MRDFNQIINEQMTKSSVSYDAGLRTYMLGIYNYMTLGLALTGLIAFFVSSSPTAMQLIFGTPLRYVVMLAPLGFVMALSFRINSMTVSTAQTLFWAYAATMGVSLSSIFLMYTNASIAKTFFIAAGTFGAMSLYGYTTQKDLSGIGSFLFMGMIGLFLASLINMFFQSSALEFALSIIGIFIFVGLTAYDTQNLKNLYFLESDSTTVAKRSIMGALQLYLDFINLFMMMLRFLGDRRS